MLKYIVIFLVFCSNLFAVDDFLIYNKADVQLLNKLTGKYEVVTLQADKPYVFDGNLYVMLRKCYKPEQQDEVDNIAFIQIAKRSSKILTNKDFIKEIPLPLQFNSQEDSKEKLNMIFSGWLYASSPSLNFIEDYVYDVTLIKCVL